MGFEFFKLFSPVIFFLYWIYSCLNLKSKYITILFLLLTSFIACSSNFSFFYREIHQAIQLLVIVFFVIFVSVYCSVNKLLSYMMFFLILIIISFIDNPFDMDARTQFINFIAIFCVLGFFLFVMKKEGDIKLFFVYFGNISVLAGFLGIIEGLIVGVDRIELTFSNPNYYALFLGLGFCLLYNYNKNDKFLFFKLLILLAAIILSGSRVGLFFPFFQILWELYLDKKVIQIVLFIFICFLSLSILNIRDKDATSGSDAERIIFAQIAVNMAKDHPLNGVGWGRYPAEFSSYTNTVNTVTLGNIEIDASNQERRVTHNDLFRILAELGIFAFIVSIGFILYNFYILLVNRNLYDRFILPTWLGVVLFSLTHNNMNSIIFWIFIFLPLIFNKFLNERGG